MKNLVITVPRLEIHRPPVSTAIIANCIKLAGHPVETLDLNCEFFHYLNSRDSYYSYDQVWDRARPITTTETKNIIKFNKPHLKKLITMIEFLLVCLVVRLIFLQPFYAD